jgi:hypothetical protein
MWPVDCFALTLHLRGLAMPTKLPPRRVHVSEENSDFSPLLGVVAALLALLVVFAEAQAMSSLPNFGPVVAPESAFAVPL